MSRRGGLPIWLGSDDEDDTTSPAGVDLYPNPLEHLSRIVNLKGHPYEFYRKMGLLSPAYYPMPTGLVSRASSSPSRWRPDDSRQIVVKLGWTMQIRSTQCQ